jgi:hypothetical protein
VLSYQDTREGEPTAGAVSLGQVDHPLAISTEANADALAAAWGYAVIAGGNEDAARASRYGDAARRIADFLTGKMWLPERKCFATGWNFKEKRGFLESEWLDSQTWTLLSLAATRGGHGHDPRSFDGLGLLDDHVTSVEWNGRMLRGFGKVTLAVDAFWSEGVAGYVLAARATGRPERFFAELEAARSADGSEMHIIGARPAEWPLDLRYPAVDGTLWAAWADPAVDFNPFRPGPTAAARASAGEGPGARSVEAERRAVERLERTKRALEKLDAVETMLRGVKEEL